MAGKQRFENLFLRHHLRAALDHDDRIPAAGKKNIDVALFQLALRRIHHPSAIDTADAHPGKRPVERDVRDVQGDRCSEHRNYIRIVLTVRRKHGCDHLSLAAQSFGK